MRIVDGLAEKYNFTAIYVWQPVLYVDKPLDEYERKISEQVDPSLKTLYLRTYEQIKKINRPRFYDISDIFADSNENIYIDCYHIGPAGNQMVAKKIFDIIYKELKPGDK